MNSECREASGRDIHRLDPEFLTNVCSVLACAPTDVENIVPLVGGCTNESVTFDVGGETYVYRRPGPGTEQIINRESETFTQNLARELGIDTTFIFEDAQKGWKVSRFVHGCEPFDYHNEAHVAHAMSLARKLHASGAKTPWSFDAHADTLKQMALLSDEQLHAVEGFDELFAMATKLNEALAADGIEPVLCHNDMYDTNFLVSAGHLDLIDWEFAGMSDYASDLSVFICCCKDYSHEDVLKIYELYFGRSPTDAELLHCVTSLAVVSFHWLVWALYKAATNDPVDEFFEMYQRYAREYCARATAMRDAAAASALP